MTLVPWVNSASMLTSEVADASTYDGTYLSGSTVPWTVESAGFAGRPYLSIYTTEGNVRPGDASFVMPGVRDNIRAQLCGVNGGNPSFTQPGGTFYYAFTVRIPAWCEYAYSLFAARNAGTIADYDLTPDQWDTGYPMAYGKWITLFELVPTNLPGVRPALEFQALIGAGGFRLCISSGATTTENTFRLGDSEGGHYYALNDPFSIDTQTRLPAWYPDGSGNLGTYFKPWVRGSDPDALFADGGPLTDDIDSSGGTFTAPAYWHYADNDPDPSYADYAQTWAFGDTGNGTPYLLDLTEDTTYTFIIGAHLDASDGWASVWWWDGTPLRSAGGGFLNIGRRIRMPDWSTRVIEDTYPVGYSGASGYEPRMGVRYEGGKTYSGGGLNQGSALDPSLLDYGRFQVWLGNGILGDDLGELQTAISEQLGFQNDDLAWQTEYVLGQSYQWLGRAGPDQISPYGSGNGSTGELVIPLGWTNGTWYEDNGCSVDLDPCVCTDCCCHAGPICTQWWPEAQNDCSNGARRALIPMPKLCCDGAQLITKDGACVGCENRLEIICWPVKRCFDPEVAGCGQASPCWPLVGFGVSNQSFKVSVVEDSSGPAGLENVPAFQVDFSSDGADGMTFVGEGGGQDAARMCFDSSNHLSGFVGPSPNDANERSATLIPALPSGNGYYCNLAYGTPSDYYIWMSFWIKAVPDMWGDTCVGFPIIGGLNNWPCSKGIVNNIRLDGSWQHVMGATRNSTGLHAGSFVTLQTTSTAAFANTPAALQCTVNGVTLDYAYPRGRVLIKNVHVGWPGQMPFEPGHPGCEGTGAGSGAQSGPSGPPGISGPPPPSVGLNIWDKV